MIYESITMKSPESTRSFPRKAGRPRTFDRDVALERAMRLFWELGYEATSLQGLTEAMGINPPSLYATFGGKEELFLAAVQRYLALHGDDPDALAMAPTARAAVEELLARSVARMSARDLPRGCLLMLGAVNCKQEAARVKRAMAAYRADGQKALAQRIARGIDDGELPSDCDARGLAAFFAAVIQGLALQARDGATRADLDRIAAVALLSWPSETTELAETAGGERKRTPRSVTGPSARKARPRPTRR